MERFRVGEGECAAVERSGVSLHVEGLPLNLVERVVFLGQHIASCHFYLTPVGEELAMNVCRSDRKFQFAGRIVLSP